MPKRPTPNWNAIELQFVNSSITLKELADKFGLNYSMLQKHSERYQWNEKRLSISQNVVAKAQSKIEHTTVKDLIAFNNDDIKIAKALRSQVAAHIMAAQDSQTKIAMADLRHLAGTAEIAQRIGRLALGVGTAHQILTGADNGPVEHATVSPEELDNAVGRVIEKF